MDETHYEVTRDDYRQLAPNEVIREGDMVREAGLDWEPGCVTTYIGKKRKEVCHFEVGRKARTEGCPPGYRWADKGENWIQYMAPTHPLGCMPYPEDSRLSDGSGDA